MIFGITSLTEIGCTFLNWSVHYLSGDTQTWREREKTWLDIPDNPLTRVNSHGFKKNHPKTMPEWKETIDILSSYDSNKIFSFHGLVRNYDHSLVEQTFVKEAISLSLDNGIKLLYLGTKYSNYNLVQRAKFSYRFDRTSRNKAYIENMKDYFKTVSDLESLTGTYGQVREFLSLNMGKLKAPEDQELIKNYLSHKDFLFVDCHELLTNEKQCLEGLFDFLNLKIDSSRMEKWLIVHSEWKKNLLPLLNFYKHLPVILSSIINGVSHPLEQYNLDIFLEAIIQYELMIRHKDRLFISKLDQFPDNTKDLTPYLKSFSITKNMGDSQK
jgi:hypothetical protein